MLFRSTAVGQRLLEAVFGDAAVRQLAMQAREDLDARADRLLRYEQSRFDELLEEAAPQSGAAERLRAAVAALAAARGARA